MDARVVVGRVTCGSYPARMKISEGCLIYTGLSCCATSPAGARAAGKKIKSRETDIHPTCSIELLLDNLFMRIPVEGVERRGRGGGEATGRKGTRTYFNRWTRTDINTLD